MNSVQAVTENVKTLAPWVVATEVDYAEQFRAHLENADKSAATVRLYLTGLRTFREWFEARTGQDFAPVAITPLDVRQFRDHLLDERKSSATVNSYLAALRAFCAWAIEADLLASDPAANVRGIKRPKKAPQWLGRQEQYMLRRAAEQRVQLGDLRADGDPAHPGAIWPRRDRAIILLMLSTGLRRAEVVNLDVEDVVIRPRSGWVTVRCGKGRKERTVPLPADGRKSVQAWLEAREHVAPKNEPALFLSQKGGRLHKRSLAGRVAVIADAAGLEDIHPHTLRHTYAKSLVDTGTQLNAVAEMMGHESVDTTAIYTMSSDQDKLQAAERISWEDSDA